MTSVAGSKKETPDSSSTKERAYENRRSGLVLFLTGLSGAGKTTIANLLVDWFESQGRAVTVLDGDAVRQHLSSELGFSKEHRDMNIRRIGFVAAEVARHGGIAICAAIAPYDEVRKQVRAMVEKTGGFFLIHVSTPLEVCERRDCKGLYAKARAGLVPGFTGISDPYQEPTDAEVIVDSSRLKPEECVAEIVSYLYRRGCVGKWDEREASTAEPSLVSRRR